MLLLALVILASPPAPASGASQRLVTGTGLRVRAAPDANAAIVEKIALGTVLPCLEESKPVTIGSATATFCKMATGWYFTALTEPLAPSAAGASAQIDALLEKRASEVNGDDETAWPDVYQVHNLMRSRIEARAGVDKTRAKLAELSFVARYARAFHADPRVGPDDSQGPRVKNEAFEKLVKEAKGTAVHEDAAWALYQHGWGGECEGYAPCVLSRAFGTACTFLAAFPEGDRAKKAVDDVIETVQSQTELEATASTADPSPSSAALGDTDDAREVRKASLAEIVKLKACIAKAKSGDTKKASAALAEAEKRARR